jgi:anti-sigma factor RsiW
MTDKNFDDFAELLPAYVNGTLAGAEHTQVEAALAASVELRDELADIEAISAMVKAGVQSDLAPVDAEMRLGRVLEQTQTSAQERPRAFTQPSIWQKFATWVATPNMRPAYAMALMALVVIQGGVLTQVLNQPKPEYGSLSGGNPKALVKPQIIIQFSDAAPMKQVTDLLANEGLRLVSGPVENIFELASAGTVLSDAELDTCIAKLRASPLVAFVDKAA